MPFFPFKSLGPGAACSVVFWGLCYPLSSFALEPAKTLSEEQREVDALIEKADSVALRKVSPRVFELATRLLTEQRATEAQRYFEKGLEGNPWALEHQLTLGEILSRDRHSTALREKAEMVLRIGEEEDVLKRAARLLARPLPERPKPYAQVKEPGTVLALLPVGTVSIFTLHDLKGVLSKRLGIKVVIAAQELKLPEADRTARQQWVARTREQVLKMIEEQPALAVQLGRLGFTNEQLRTDDEAFVSMVRKTTEMEQGEAAVQALDTMLAQSEKTMQWDVEKLITVLQSAVGDRVGAKQLVLGITPCDLFGGTSNYLFGAGNTGKYLGIISLHRFRASFNDEAPKRERFTQRLLKQSLSTIGFMLGVPRCNTPECARAFPQSLAEHDQKASTLCPNCRAGFEAALGRKLPPE